MKEEPSFDTTGLTPEEIFRYTPPPPWKPGMKPYPVISETCDPPELPADYVEPVYETEEEEEEAWKRAMEIQNGLSEEEIKKIREEEAQEKVEEEREDRERAERERKGS